MYMKKIPVQNNNSNRLGALLYAMVDDEDYAAVSAFHWHLNSVGFAKSCTAEGNRFMHRMILEAPRDKIVEHVNKNGLDNRKENLRLYPLDINLRRHDRKRHIKE